MTDQSHRLIAALTDRYRIEHELGAGGMATVYLAEDLKHKRQVAVKVLRPELAAVLGAERFVQEIETTAKLQHPHILPLFDSGRAEAGGDGQGPQEFLYYVMPYIDGETLRDKLNRETQLGIEEAVRIASEVADALDYAHRHDVIHRDIKPENILLHDGRAMVADFGIALAVSAAAGNRMTETGLSLGTPHYMSPEQATAEKELTNRSDIYSLGAVLYEMVTGDPPHTGSSAQQIIMKIVTDDARRVTDVRRAAPPHVSDAIATALEKLPADRFGTAHAFRQALTEPAYRRQLAGGSEAGAGTQWPKLAGAFAAGAVAVAVIGLATGSNPSTGPATYDVGLPEGAAMVPEYGTVFSVAPNGEFVVYVADDDPPSIWYRSLVDDTAYRIVGTEGVTREWIALSPDGTRLAFVANGVELKVVPLVGGDAVSLGAVSYTTGMHWTPDGVLWLSDGDGSLLRLFDVNAREETVYAVSACLMPWPLDDDHVLCGGGGSQVAIVRNIHDDTFRPLRIGTTPDDTAGALVRGADFRVVADDYLVYMSSDGDLRAALFDQRSFAVGRSTVVIPGVRRESYSGAGQWAVTPSGTLVYTAGRNADRGTMVRVQPGQPIETLPLEPDLYLRFDISPDGRRLAMVVTVDDGQELRVYELASGRYQTWLTSRDQIFEPVWIRGGDALAVVTRDMASSAWWLLTGVPNASAPPDTIMASPDGFGTSMFSNHGDSIVVGNVWESALVLQLDLTVTPPTIDTLVEGIFGLLSPDQRWLTYQDKELNTIWVQPYPELDRQYRLVVNASEPQWRSPGELVYWDRTTWYSLMIPPGTTEPMGTPEVLHEDPLFSDTPGHSYTITADGELVYVQAPAQPPVTYLRVIPNWVTDMKGQVAEANRT